MSETGVMTDDQEAIWAYINNSWPIASYFVNEQGLVEFACDSGATGWIDQTGSWGWD